MPDHECSHGGGAAFVESVCVLCGFRRKAGRPPKRVARMQLAEVYAMGRDAVSSSAPAEPASVEAKGEYRPSWLRFDGKLKQFARNPLPYKRKGELPQVLNEHAKQEATIAERLRAVRERLGRLSLAEFIKLGWHVVNRQRLYWSWHMQAVADHVQRVFEELLKARTDADYEMAVQNLMVNIPPRSAKSMIISVFAPAWVWLHDPTLKIRCMSSNGTVANRDSRYCRDLVGSSWYRETFRIKWGIRSDVDGVEQFANTEQGVRIASTFQARITGEGTDVIIVDDPHDADEVNSEAKRVAVLERWDTAIESRVEDEKRCVRIGVMQRLHEADWAGHVLGSGTWLHLFIPMEYEPDRACRTQIGTWSWSDPRTKPGELLQPERFPLKALRGVDKDGNPDPNGRGGKYHTLGSYGYAGQMQQRPAPADGGMFKRSWWSKYDVAPERFDQLIISVDCNAKKTIDGSRTSCLVVGRKGPQRFVIDNVTRITDFEEILEIITELRTKHPTVAMTIVEDKANGPSVVAMLKKRLGRIEECKVGSDSKESRARAIAPTVEAGDVWLPRHAAWLDDFMHEVSTFPNGARDDQVDALSQALIYMEGDPHAARFRAAFNS